MLNPTHIGQYLIERDDINGEVISKQRIVGVYPANGTAEVQNADGSKEVILADDEFYFYEVVDEATAAGMKIGKGTTLNAALAGAGVMGWTD